MFHPLTFIAVSPSIKKVLNTHFYMDEQLEILHSTLVMMEEAILKRDQQLFNAFCLSHPDLLPKKLSYDFEDLSLITIAFYEYRNKLEQMGKHKLFTG